MQSGTTPSDVRSKLTRFGRVLRGGDALRPGAALAVFAPLVGRPATPTESAEYERHVPPPAQPEAVVAPTQ
jgi:hypothetical protein